MLTKPTNKIMVGALAGAVMTVVAWAAKQWGKIDVPAEVAVAGTAIITAVLQYVVPDAPSSTDESEEQK